MKRPLIHTPLILLLLMCCTATVAQRDKAELKRLKAELDSCRTALVAQQQQDSALIDSLRNELQALSAFRDEFVKDKLLKSSPDLTLPCSQADDASLASFLHRLNPFRSDSLVDSTAISVERYRQLCQEYNQQTAPLNSPYDKSLAKGAFDRLLTMEKQEDISTAQAIEFHHTAVVLSKYMHCVRIIQDIIKTIDQQLEPYLSSTSADTQTFCIELVNNIVNKIKTNEQADNPRYKYIDEIPYLAQRYNAYLNCMTSTPLNMPAEVQAAKNDLLNIKID